MILGMTVANFTIMHTLLSLIGIVSGCVVLAHMLRSRRNEIWTLLFLISTVLACVTGFFFPTKFDPPKMIGLVTLAILAATCVALYFNLSKKWRLVYIVGATLAVYLNVFVGVIQAFQKVYFLHKLAPKQSDPAFLVVQIAFMALFIVLGYIASKSFKPGKRA